MSRRSAVASIIVGGCQALAARSRRFELLIGEIVSRLTLAEEMRLPPGENVFTTEELLARTEEFNRASEQYFVDLKDEQHLLTKPFSDTLLFPRAMFDLGVLMRWLRLSPGEVVVELGAGTCWLSHLLNRYGCRTIAVDVSETALQLGRQLFERESSTNWDLRPEFLVYDGHRIPLEDGSVDKVVIYHAFHHVPNQREILSELHRILVDGGIVAMCEPGRRHSSQLHSRQEMEEHGVLENELVVEDLEQVALQCGFSRLCVVPVAATVDVEVPARDLAGFMRGKGLWDYWRQLCVDLKDSPYIVVYKGAFVPTSRKPQHAAARIEVVGGGEPLTIARSTAVRVQCRVTNTGDTRWLANIDGHPGWTRLGAHLYRADAGSAVIDFDWSRGRLPKDVNPGDQVMVEIELPGIAEAGAYRVVFDLVAEGIMWFAQHQSPTTELRLLISD